MDSGDLVFNGASVIDGSGSASRIVEVAVDRESIVDIGDCRHWQADTLINAGGLALPPGFIDSHRHDDLAIFKSPDITFKISQGVTTLIAADWECTPEEVCERPSQRQFELA